MTKTRKLIIAALFACFVIWTGYNGYQYLENDRLATRNIDRLDRQIASGNTSMDDARSAERGVELFTRRMNEDRNNITIGLIVFVVLTGAVWITGRKSEEAGDATPPK